MTQMVWMSTVDVPTGEFIEVEYSIVAQRINKRYLAGTAEDEVIIN